MINFEWSINMKNRVFEVTLVNNEIQIGHDGYHAARLVLNDMINDNERIKVFIKDFIAKRADYFKGITDEFKVVFIDDENFEEELNDIIR
jgi:hypothetical protein